MEEPATPRCERDGERGIGIVFALVIIVVTMSLLGS